MAEAPGLYAESLEKLDQELTCPICLKHFEEPKVLPCCHYYCRECIVQMQARTRGKDYFQCPECRKETRLPGNDPDSLLTAFFVNRMKELFSMMQKAQGKVELTCESCRRGTTPVESFCRHCALFICQSCEEAHRTMRPFSNHVVVPLDDLRQNTAAHFPVKKEAQIKCKEHGSKMKLYCHDCHQLICRDCIVKDHKEHEYDFVNKAAVQCRASLKESVAPLRKIQASLSHAVIETEKATSAVSQSGADIAAAIDLKFDELIASVQKRREELHCEAREKLEANQKSLTAQRKNIQQATAEVQSMIEFVDHKSQRANDQELLGLQKQIHDRVNEVAQKYSNPIGQFKPTRVCYLELRCTSQSAIESITLDCQGTPSPLSPKSNIFSNLSPEVLALLAKIPEGDLPGVQYHPKEGTVNVESQSKEELEDHNKRSHKSKSFSAAGGMEEDKNCPICLDEFTNPKRTKCGHQFCSGCLKEALKRDPFCPTCKQPLRSIIGKQPVGGQMTHRTLYGRSLPGYQGYNTIQIDYYIPGGVQGPEHPNPGWRFSGTSRTAFLPDTHEGREVLKLLKKAFDARLIFTVGTSVTTGTQNTVVWNDIHHKTSMHGGPYGYPDHTYLQRVKEDLAAKGIVSTSSIV